MARTDLIYERKPDGGKYLAPAQLAAGSLRGALLKFFLNLVNERGQGFLEITLLCE